MANLDLATFMNHLETKVSGVKLDSISNPNDMFNKFLATFLEVVNLEKCAFQTCFKKRQTIRTDTLRLKAFPNLLKQKKSLKASFLREAKRSRTITNLIETVSTD